MNFFKILLCALLAIPSASFAMEKPGGPLKEIKEIEISKQKHLVPSLRLLSAHKAVTSDPYMLAQKDLPKDIKEYLLEAKLHQKDIAKKHYTKILSNLAIQRRSSTIFTQDIAHTQAPDDLLIHYSELLTKAICAGNYACAQMLCKDYSISPSIKLPKIQSQKFVNEWIQAILQSKSCYPKAQWINLLAKNLEHIEKGSLKIAVQNDCEEEAIELLAKYLNPVERQAALNEALVVAAFKDNEKAVEFLLEQGADCGSVPHTIETPITNSLILNFKTHWLSDRIRTLLLSYDEQQKFVNQKDNFRNERTPLMTAILHQRSIEELEQLLEHGADVYAKDNQGQTALAYLCCSGFNKPKADLLLSYDEQNRLINELDCYGNSLLYYAIQHTADAQPNRKDTVAWILEHDTQKKLINYSTENCNSALHTAINCVDVDIIKLLIDNGANIYARNRDGLTCLQAILTKDHSDNSKYDLFPKRRAAIELLLAEDRTKTLINTISEQSALTPILLATSHTYLDPELIYLLIKNGADLYAKEPETGKTVIHKIIESQPAGLMVRQDFSEAKRRLCFTILQRDTRKILANEPDNQGKSPLLKVVMQADEECAKLLIELGANPYAQDNQGRNLLHHLVTQQHEFSVYILNTVLGIDQNRVLQKQQDKNGNTPLMLHLQEPIQRYEDRKFDWILSLGLNTDLKAIKNNNGENAFDIANKYQQNSYYFERIIETLNRLQEHYHNQHYPYENTIRTLSTLGTPGAIAASVLHYYTSKPKEDKK